MSDLLERKQAHLDLCARAEVEARRSTLLEQVHLLHDALPELAFDEVDPSVELLGRRLLAPVVMTGMTGGTERAGRLNRALAAAAQKCGLGLGVGSQRVMLQAPECVQSFQVREVAPDVLLLANLGAVQARDCPPDQVAELVAQIGADALCIHLNPAQELVQDDGDRDFRGCLAAIAVLAAELPVPVVVKETGCGLAPGTLERIRKAGVRWVDVSGAGGTSWTAVESLRGSERQRQLGRALREWGVPTAPSIAFAVQAGLGVIASGGVRSPLDAARALALGAHAVGLALPFLRAFEAGGPEGVLEEAQRLCEGIRALLVLTGARCIAELRQRPRMVGADLRLWLEMAGIPWQA